MRYKRNTTKIWGIRERRNRIVVLLNVSWTFMNRAQTREREIMAGIPYVLYSSRYDGVGRTQLGRGKVNRSETLRTTTQMAADKIHS